MPSSPTQQQKAAAAAAQQQQQQQQHVPALERLGTHSNQTPQLLRGQSFAKAIRDDRTKHKEEQQQQQQQPTIAATNVRRSSHQSAVAYAQAENQTPRTSSTAAGGGGNNNRLSQVVARGFTTNVVPTMEREPTMLHSKDRLVPSISPVRHDRSFDDDDDDDDENNAAAAVAAASASSLKDNSGDFGSPTTGVAGGCKFSDEPSSPSGRGSSASQMRKYSVVLDLDETVVYGREGELIARSHLKQFMRSLDSSKLEIIVWTAAERSYAKQVVKEINENRVIRHCIYRDKNWFDAKDYTKDLAKLGRSMDTVLIVENTPDCIRENPQNGIIVSDFEGDSKAKDSTLLKLSQLIQNLCESQLPVPKFLATCSMLRRQVVECGERNIPIFFLSSRAQRKPKAGSPTSAVEGDASETATITTAGSSNAADEGGREEDVKVVKMNRDRVYENPPPAAVTTKAASASSSSEQQQHHSTPKGGSAALAQQTPPSSSSGTSPRPLSQSQQQRTPAGTSAGSGGSMSTPARKILTPRNRPILKSPSTRGVVGTSLTSSGFDAPTGLPSASKPPRSLVSANSPRGGGASVLGGSGSSLSQQSSSGSRPPMHHHHGSGSSSSSQQPPKSPRQQLPARRQRSDNEGTSEEKS